QLRTTAAYVAKSEAAPATGGSARNNVFTFPTEAAPKQDEFAPPQPEPAPRLVENASESDAARAASAAENAAARQAESDYNRTRGPAAPGLPEASFLGLVNMLAVAAAMPLGRLCPAG